MGGFFAPATTIGGTVLAPGIPLSSSPTSGLYQSTQTGVGIALSGLSFFELNLDGLTIGDKLSSAFGLSNVAGSPYAFGNTPNNTAVSPDNLNLFVTDVLHDTLVVYSINPTTGVLTTSPGSPYAVGSGPYEVTITPDGKFVIVASRSVSTLSVFSRNTVTGALTPVVGSPFASVANVRAVKVSPDGIHVIAVGDTSNSVAVYTIDDTTGHLTAVAGSPFATGTTPYDLIITPDGKYVCVANNISNNLSVYALNSVTGFLTPVTGSPFAAGHSPVGVASSPLTGFILVTNSGDATIDVFSIDSLTGHLTRVSGSPFATSTGGQYLCVSNDNYVYCPCGNTINVFTLNPSNGFLTPVAGSPFAFGSSNYSVSVTNDSSHVFVSSVGTGSILALNTTVLPSYNLITSFFDPAGGLNGWFNVNGILLNEGVPVLNRTSADARYAQLSGAIFTGLITPASLIGIKGTSTNDNVQAGSVGEYIESTVLLAAAVALTTAVTANVTSIALTAGDWDVEGIVAFHGSGTTNINDVTAGTNNVSATVGPVGSYVSDYLTIVVATSPDATYLAPKRRYSLNAPTTIYLVALSNFSASTCTAYGHISARRVR